jgi:hypothetical protein
LFHNKMSVPEDICEKSMTLNIDFHNFWEIHNLKILLKYEWTMKDDEFISNDDNEIVIVSYNSKYELDKTIIYQEKNDWEKHIINDVRSILRQFFFIYQKWYKKYPYYDYKEKEFRYEVQKINKMFCNNSIILFCKYIHSGEL